MAESLQDNIQNTATTIKLPPNSQEAEQSVLGGLMLNDQHWFDLVDILQPSDFYRNQHQLIYQAMIELANQDEALDAVTASEKLKSKAILEKAGGIEYLGQLAESSTGASNVLAYARIIRERSVLRQLIGAANQIADSAFSTEGKDSETLLEKAEQAIFSISEREGSAEGPMGIDSLLTLSLIHI